ncbi:unnamed protein product [Bemisia tabaci]|uniref:Cytochrome P450 n=1 Tax=Bemisia tabaci TaxID=7038 RepID=A0A9P0F5R6_BEMTA|nr:unnamed protein product [Bemisia tabaci]
MDVLHVIGYTVGILFVTVYLLEAYLHWRRRPLIKLMKSIRKIGRNMPVVGHIWLMWGKLEHALYTAEKLVRHYGQDGNFAVWIVDRVYVVLVKPEDLALTLGSPHFISKSTEYTIMQSSIMGQGLFSVTDVNEWRKNRKLITPAFHFQILKTFIDNFHMESKILIDNVRNQMDNNGEVEVHRFIGLCTLDMITKNAMGVTVEAQKNSTHVFVQGMETVLHVWYMRIISPWLLSNAIFSLTSLKTRHDTAMRGVQAFATQVILEKLEARHLAATSVSPVVSGQEEDDAFCRSRNTRAFLDLLIDTAYEGVDQRRMACLIASLRRQKDAQHEPGFWARLRGGFGRGRKPLADKRETAERDTNNNADCGATQVDGEEDAALERVTCQLRDEVVTIMVGGQETTACENSFAILMLALHQDVQRKVTTELAEIFGSDCRPPSYDDLQRMAYLECVIKETMRLFPALPVMARVAQQNTTLSDNSFLPKGCTVVAFIYSLHRDPRYFPEPNRFWPERFLPENSGNRHPYSYIPFAAGARNCIGQKYAMLQMKTILSTVLREFRILPSQKMPNMDSIRLLMTSTLRSKTGCWVRLQPRSSSSSA